jgi:hypothetical protein
MNFTYIGVGVVWSFVLWKYPKTVAEIRGVSLGTHFRANSPTFGRRGDKLALLYESYVI